MNRGIATGAEGIASLAEAWVPKQSRMMLPLLEAWRGHHQVKGIWSLMCDYGL